MENKMKNIEELKRDTRAGYKVPEGYFSELNHKIVATSQQTAQGGAWATLRSMTSFVMSFAVMVVIAITGYYFTGHQAQTQEYEDENYYMISLYDISTEDIIQAQELDSDTKNSQFADAAIDYLTTYGYDITEITE